jgi:hypothetical protein
MVIMSNKIIKVCACGCGREIVFKPHHRYHNPIYIAGHNWRGEKRGPQSEEHLANIAKVCRRMNGKHHSIKSKQRISKSNKGKGLGRVRPLAEKLSIGKGSKRVWDNYTKEQKEARIDLHAGKNHWNWRSGVSREPYSVDWTRTLKRSIRERDQYTCQICGKEQCDRAFDVHHIDYDKQNCNPTNLVTLCRVCHVKTSINREYWREYFSTGAKV